MLSANKCLINLLSPLSSATSKTIPNRVAQNSISHLFLFHQFGSVVSAGSAEWFSAFLPWGLSRDLRHLTVWDWRVNTASLTRPGPPCPLEAVPLSLDGVFPGLFPQCQECSGKTRVNAARPLKARTSALHTTTSACSAHPRHALAWIQGMEKNKILGLWFHTASKSPL